jgi:hypothetical protein
VVYMPRLNPAEVGFTAEGFELDMPTRPAWQVGTVIWTMTASTLEHVFEAMSNRCDWHARHALARQRSAAAAAAGVYAAATHTPSESNANVVSVPHCSAS